MSASGTTYRFNKLHGCGNDYVFIDTWQQPVPSDAEQLSLLARLISDRHRGVGGDGLILIGPQSRLADAAMIAENNGNNQHDLPTMRMFNSDGSESEMCGNGLRAAVMLAWRHGHLSASDKVFMTGAGPLSVQITDDDPEHFIVAITMGPPRLRPDAIPVLSPPATPGEYPIILQRRIDGHDVVLHAVGMGNPHAVCFVDDAEQVPLAQWGPVLEYDNAFPARANIEFVSALGPQCWRQRTWERGSGETEACGTGACAVAVAAVCTKRAQPGRQQIRLNGGDLHIDWSGSADDAVIMTGPATHVCDGEWWPPVDIS